VRVGSLLEQAGQKPGHLVEQLLLLGQVDSRTARPQPQRHLPADCGGEVARRHPDGVPRPDQSGQGRIAQQRSQEWRVTGRRRHVDRRPRVRIQLPAGLLPAGDDFGVGGRARLACSAELANLVGHVIQVVQ